LNTLIYKGTCLANGKVYIGLTTMGLEHRKNNHERTSNVTKRNNKLYNAMRKYGKDCFIWNIIEYCNESELEDRERFWIKYFDSYYHGYNSTTGGERKKEVSQESRTQMGIGHRGQVAWCKGKKLPPLTEEHKAKIKIFAQEYKTENRMAQKNRKPIRCIETGIEYDSIRDCCAKTGLNRLSVSRTLRGIYGGAGDYWGKGYHFEPSAGGYNS